MSKGAQVPPLPRREKQKSHLFKARGDVSRHQEDPSTRFACHGNLTRAYSASARELSASDKLPGPSHKRRECHRQRATSASARLTGPTQCQQQVSPPGVEAAHVVGLPFIPLRSHSDESHLDPLLWLLCRVI